MEDYFKYRFGDDISFNLNSGDFISIIGNTNDLFVFTLLHGHKECNLFVGDKEFNQENKDEIRSRMCVVLYKHLNIFSGETVKDEIAFGLESLAMKKDDMTNLIESESRLFKVTSILDRDPNSLGLSDKVKIKILSALIIKPKVIIIDNLLSELDYNDKMLVLDILDEFRNNGGIVINVTNDMEETLFSDRIIILYNKKLVCDGKTLSVLNEEKLLKRLGLGLPFIVELNKYLMDYGMIDKYYLTDKKLVGALWK